LGKRVYEFLKARYTHFVTDETTRRLEEMMDKVEKGEISYESALKHIHSETLSMD